MIIADVHEPEHLKEIADEVRELPVDYVIVGSERKYMVERKEVLDLWNSVKDGRFWRQMLYLEKSREEGYIPVVIIEGSWGKLMKFAKGVKPRNIMGIQLAFGSFGVVAVVIPPTWTKDFLIFLDEKSGKVRRFPRPTIPKPIERTLHEERLDVLMAIRGIGEKTAEQLLQRFGRLINVFSASGDELREVLKSKADHFLEVVWGEDREDA